MTMKDSNIMKDLHSLQSIKCKVVNAEHNQNTITKPSNKEIYTNTHTLPITAHKTHTSIHIHSLLLDSNYK